MNLEEPRNEPTAAPEAEGADNQALNALRDAVRDRQGRDVASPPGPCPASQPATDQEDSADRMDLNELRDRMQRGERIELPPGPRPEIGSDEWYRATHFVNPRLHPDEPSGPSIHAIREAWIAQHPDSEPPWTDQSDEPSVRSTD